MAAGEQERGEIVRRIVAEVARRMFPVPTSASSPPREASRATPDPVPSGGPAIGWTSARSRPLVTAQALAALAPGSSFRLPEGAMLTPLAREVAADRRIALLAEPSSPAAPAAAATAPAPPAIPPGSRIAIGADHAGFRTKEALRAHLRERGYDVRDFGTSGERAVDYPDFARAVAEAVSRGECAVGILADGAGVGSAIAANKVPGVRAASCADLATARSAREHNFANVLCLPARALDEAGAKGLVQAFLETATGGERHARRVGKIEAIERAYLRPSVPRPA